jgi:hypothetical protein
MVQINRVEEEKRWMLLFVVCLIVDASTLQLHDSITRDDDDRKRKSIATNTSPPLGGGVKKEKENNTGGCSFFENPKRSQS